MKYCPYCGAPLLGSAVSFCSECGKSVRIINEQKASEPAVAAFPQTENEKSSSSKEMPADKTARNSRPPNRPSSHGRQQARPPRKPTQNRMEPLSGPPKRSPGQPPGKKKAQPPKPPMSKKRKKKPHEPAYVPQSDPRDLDYDGYYDDIPVEDNGATKETLDPEVIKRIGFIIGGALVIVILSVVIMYVL